MMTIISDWILLAAGFAFAFQVFTLFNYLRNRYYITAIPKENQKKDTPITQATISVCIPARNEANNIVKTIDSLLKQTHPPFEILVLDDQSTDETYQLVEAIAKVNPSVKLFKGMEKPSDWLGKNWACHQLSEKANGTILIFQDADVWMSGQAIERIATQFDTYDAVTVWPHQILGSFFERLVLPGVYYALLTLFPAAYLNQKPKWLPASIYPRFKHLFAAANGQLIGIKKAVYQKLGGHKSVKMEVVEDMALAKLIKTHDYLVGMFHGADTVYCRMYHNAREVWEGFSKNFMAGFPNTFSFVAMAFVHVLSFIFPVVLLFIPSFRLHSDNSELILYFSIVSVAIFTFIRIHLGIIFKWKMVYSFIHFGTVLWFQILGIALLWNKIIGKKSHWKGREIS